MIGRLLLLCLLSVAICNAAAQRPESATNAEAFCNGTDIQKLKCDWAGDEEQNKVASGTFAGTMWTAELKPPETLTGARSYFQFASKVVSLACKPGRLTVRTVFKLLPDSKGCSRLVLEPDTLGSLGSDPSSVRRCRLQVAGPAGNGTDAAAIKAALAAREGPCVTCVKCDSSCTEQRTGVWYSDTISFQYAGCKGLGIKPDEGYIPTKPAVVVNPGNNILLAGMTLKQA